MFVHSGIKIVNVNHCQVSINTSNLGVSYVECTYSHRYKMGRKKYVCAISFFLCQLVLKLETITTFLYYSPEIKRPKVNFHTHI